MLFFRFLSYLPFGILYALADFLYLITFYVIGYRKKVVVMNLKNAFPEKNDTEIAQLTKGFYRNLCDTIVETLKLLTISGKELENMVEVRGMEQLLSYHEQNEVILIFSNHLNCWEIIPPRTIQSGIPCDVIYKPLSNKFFDKLMFTIRSRFGIQPIPMKQTLREVVKKKGQSRILGIISDQAAETPEVAHWTTFLNQETDFFTGTEKMARSFNYPVVYGELIRKKRGSYILNYSTLIERPYSNIAQGEITEAYVKALERSIKENPSDWLWSHRRFKHKRV
jgi:KDO2-lipid IV(A) lauroyltransferase